MTSVEGSALGPGAPVCVWCCRECHLLTRQERIPYLTSTDHSLKVKSPKWALSGDLPGGQETHSTGVSTGLQGWPAGPVGTPEV